MKKRLIVACLCIVVLLTALIPAAASARNWSKTFDRIRTTRFSSVLTPTSIDDTVIGNTWPARDSATTNVWPIIDLIDGEPAVTGWIVDGRTIHGDVTGDLAGRFSFTYGGILDLLQTGSIQGIVAIETAQGVVYLASDGESETRVTAYYEFDEIAAWCNAAGVGVGQFFAVMYNRAELSLLPDGLLAFSDIQAWCAAIGVPVGAFLADVYGMPELAGLDEATLEGMYGTVLPPFPGLSLLSAMYGDPLPLLPRVLTAEFSGSVRVDAGTGRFTNITGQGSYRPQGPLTLYVYPDQHVFQLEGNIKFSGYYRSRPTRHDWTIDRERLGELFESDGARVGDLIEKWRQEHGDD